MKKTLSILLYILFFASFSLVSQNISTKKYLSENGLPSNFVYQVYQGSNKFLWFATEVGISRFDGKHFKNYDFDDNLPDNVIYEIKETKDKKKWLLSGNGELSYISSNDSIIRYPDLTTSKFISELVETENGRLIVGSFGDGIKIKTNNKAFHITKKNGLPDNYVSFIWNSEEDLFALSSLGISKIRKNNSVEIIHKFEKTISFSRACKLDENRILFSAKDKIYLFSNNKKLVELKNGTVITQNMLNKVCLLKDGQLVACTNKGVQFFKVQNDSIIVTKEVLKNIPTTSLIIDHEGSYWATTLGEGVITFRENFISRVGVQKKAYCFYKGSDDNLYIGYENYQFAKRNEDTIAYINLNRKNSFSNQKIKSILYNDNKFWYLLDGGLATHINNKTTFYRTLSGVTVFNDSLLLIGGKTGYFKIRKQFLLDSLVLDENKPRVVLPEKRRLLDISTTSIAKYKTGFFIGTKKGLYYDDGNKVEAVKHKTLSSVKITDLCIKDKFVVVSTFGYGVFLISNRDTIYFNEQNGLTSNFCQSVFVDNNLLYIGTNKGLNIISDFEGLKPKVNSITKQDGLLNEDIQSVIVDKNKVLLATLGGVFEFQQNNISKINYEIPLYIEELKVNDSPIDFSSSGKYSYQQNRMSFRFTPISFRYSDRVKMYYSLGNEEWKVFNGDYLDFLSLKPGKYTIQIKAVINKVNSQIVTYSFIISPPFWKTWWFFISSGLLISLVIYWFFKVRVLTYNRDVVRELILLFINKLKKEDFVLIKNVKDGSYTKVILNKVLYVKGAGNYIEFTLLDSNKILARMTMQNILSKLNEGKKQKFIRCHKSYVVNKKNISAVHSDFIKIKEEKIPIGKQYMKNISEKLEILELRD